MIIFVISSIGIADICHLIYRKLTYPPFLSTQQHHLSVINVLYYGGVEINHLLLVLTNRHSTGSNEQEE